MRQTDIVIIGGGLAGSTAAAMLGRAGIETIVIDPHVTYPFDFRCEKLDATQVEILRKTGLADLVLPATAKSDTLWIARYGLLIDKKPGGLQHGIMYDDLVNTVRAAIPSHVDAIHAKATGATTSDDRQVITTSDGEEVSARLIVLANGLNLTMRHQLGVQRHEISHCHSITIGFDMTPVGRAAFDFPALTYYPESPHDKGAYLTLFPVPGAMRANYMVYRDLSDPWLLALRKDPKAALLGVMPGLTRITGDFDVTNTLRVRPADLTVTQGHEQAGLVLVGDAFSTSCPAAGTGTGKVFTDVERLCNVYIPQWLATPGMGREKIAAFYADPVKQAYDSFAIAKAFDLKSLSIDTAPKWRARRMARFVARAGAGTWRRLRGALPSGTLPGPSGTAGATHA